MPDSTNQNVERYDRARITETIISLFPAPVSACVADTAMYDAPLWPKEYESVRSAVRERQREFAAGRSAARLALAALGIVSEAIEVGKDRAPIWPPGSTGSITHCSGFCGAVVAYTQNIASLGFDAETADDFPPEIEPLVFNSQEISGFAELPPLRYSSWKKLAFSAKESFFKCYYPLTGYCCEFLDVSVSFRPPERNCRGQFVIAPRENIQNELILKDLMGRWAVCDRLTFTGVAHLSL